MTAATSSNESAHNGMTGSLKVDTSAFKKYLAVNSQYGGGGRQQQISCGPESTSSIKITTSSNNQQINFKQLL